MTPWKQVTIIGTGLVGGSLGLALKRAGLAGAVVGVGHRQATLDETLRRGAADRATLDVREGVRGSDLVVLATAVGLFERMLRQAREDLAPGATVIDVGSTKAQVVRTLEPLLPEGCALVGCHPIAGSERRGISFARADLFEGATCVVTPTARTPREALGRVVATWEALGMTVCQMAPEAHDRLLAEVSHLPHAAAAALVRVISDEAEAFVGPGWADTTRIASGDAALWRDILVTNADEIAAALERYQAVLAGVASAVRRRDADAIEALLAASKTRRDRLTRRSGG